MSGIVAAHGPFEPRLGLAMLERLAHRGSGGRASRAVGGSWLGEQRSPLASVSAGERALSGTDGELWLVGDGELARPERLAAANGARPGAAAGGPLALALYEREGPAALARLSGTFAVAIAGADGRFAAARDALGIAPLYWARRDGTVLFASELKAFDERWQASVEPFPIGHAWTPDGGLRRLSALPAAAGEPGGRPDRGDPSERDLAALRDVLIAAVERALRAGGSAGVLLSGGLDSSIVAAIAARAAARDGGEPLPTYAAGLAGSPDLRAARAVAECVGSDHHEVALGAEEAIALVEEVIGVLESFDPTLVHSAVPNYLVARLASDDVDAVLIGEGADELFAGYAHYARHEVADDLHEELLETIAGLHIGGLQRVDRVTSANGVRARIPFLDPEVVAFALALPAAWKLVGERRPAKWLLRRAFEGWLPGEVLWREKAQFGQGTGINSILREHFGALVSDDDLRRERDAVDPPLRTREELAYQRIVARQLPGVRAGATIGRFVEA